MLWTIVNYLKVLEPFWVLLLGIPLLLPGRITPLALHPYLLISLLFFWLLHWRVHLKYNQYKKVYSTIHSPLAIPICLLLLWLPITIWVSVDRTASWVAAGYLVWGIALYITIVNWSPIYAHPEWLSWLLLGCGLSLALVSPFLIVWKPTFRLFYLPLYDRLQAIQLTSYETIHANVLAGVLVLILPLLLVLILHNVRGFSSCIQFERTSFMAICFVGLLFIYSFGLLVLTQSRGGLLALLTSLFLVLFVHRPRSLYFVLLSTPLAVFFHDSHGLTLLNQISSDGSLGGWADRLTIWRWSLDALYDFVFTGIGIGAFTKVIPLLYPLHIDIEGYPHAHNLLLQIGVDLGLPGLIAYLALLFNLFAMLISVLRNQPRHSLNWTLAVGSLGSLVAILTHGLLDAVTWGTKLAFMPWLLYALITLLFLQTQQQILQHEQQPTQTFD